MSRTIEVRHCVHVSERPFDEVVAAFMLATGSVEEGFGSVAAGATTREEFEAAFRAREGSSGLERLTKPRAGPESDDGGGDCEESAIEVGVAFV
ncbi:hypothetical protein J2X65_005311, partial [Ancylobacter sp. 3268]|uniref:hypothetical protein n=1 Tax=Ancylobacter sp. 3268 TaxID=2817752 RepID=UPI0028606F2A